MLGFTLLGRRLVHENAARVSSVSSGVGLTAVPSPYSADIAKLFTVSI
jgi:hypothetical protein